MWAWQCLFSRAKLRGFLGVNMDVSIPGLGIPFHMMIHSGKAMNATGLLKYNIYKFAILDHYDSLSLLPVVPLSQPIFSWLAF